MGSKAQLQLTSKAKNLAIVRDNLSAARVLPLFSFTACRWKDERLAVLAELKTLDWARQALIIRSSCHNEDTEHGSLAGHYHSELNVSGCRNIEKAIQRVVESMGDAPNSEDCVFIQPMLQRVKRCGVVFTATQNIGAPYYVINVDESSGSTETVTAGATNDLSLYYIAKSIRDISPEKYASLPAWIQSVFCLASELEALTGNSALDIEFAEDEKGDLYLFQVRAMVNVNLADVNPQAHQESLTRIVKSVRRLSAPHPYLCGKRGIYGVMPDWNPAEIIGLKPKPLALSLYKELITDSIWAYQRDNYGYRKLRSFPLLIDFEGLPYVDVRVSFNSFVPKSLPEELADKLVNYYIDQLIEQPSKHDKIEFDIIFSCYTFDIDHKLEALKQHSFSQNEIASLKSELRQLTNSIISDQGLWLKDIEKINCLVEHHQRILTSDLSSIEKIFWLIEDCKRYGTLPFAGLARAGFIAVQMLRSLLAVNAIDQHDYDAFMASLNTVSKQMTQDIDGASQQEFLQKYGHLRPGTYDITSLRYDHEESNYFSEYREQHNVAPPLSGFSLSLDKLDKIQLMLKEHQVNLDVLGLFKFIKGAIEGREFAKFVFTRSLSDLLELLHGLGGKYGYDRNDMAMFDIDKIRTLYSSAASVKETITHAIEAGKAKYKNSLSIHLPGLIVEPENVLFFKVEKGEPNFITNKSVTAQVYPLRQGEHRELDGKIVCIPAADPGFDWLFSHKIAGLVTQFGGANSHMAIRAAELEIPAVIGCGEKTYEFIAQKKVVTVDCACQKIEVLY